MRSALEELFHGKCAYCESVLPATETADIDWFRPKASATDLDGKTSIGYWWLAYEWTNLYYCCQLCNRKYKRNRFPVRHARATSPGADLAAEGAYLIDPCIEDPAEHLSFGLAGGVEGKTDRGVVSIEILGLSRSDLVAQRKAAIEALRLELALAFATGDAARIKEITDKTADPAYPFAAARRQSVHSLIEAEAKARPSRTRAEKKAVRASLSELANEALSRPAPSAKVKRAARRLQREVKAYSVEDRGQAEHYQLGGGNRWIERVVIDDFKGIEHLELEFPREATETEPWLVLLGENSTGKSSVLQAVALTLAGERVANALDLDPLEFIRFGQPKATVAITLSGDPEPETIRLSLSRRSKRFRVVPQKPKMLLAAYGATRLPPRRDAASRESHSEVIRVENLFDPYWPLGDPTEWLLARTELQWTSVAEAIERMLGDPDDRLIPNPTKGQIEVSQSGMPVPLASLSDGYKAAITLAVDVMRFFTQRTENIADAVGIVVLDEIGPHLHPRWKMKVVEQLRAAFPQVRFLATTHDPLCLRGLRAGEVVVMERDESDKIVAITDLPSIEGLRVDQILTSDHFGLHSAADPQLDAFAREYSTLLSKQDKSPADRSRLEELRTEIERLQVLGSTPFEQLRYAAIEAFLASRSEQRALLAKTHLPSRAVEKLAELWQADEQALPRTP